MNELLDILFTILHVVIILFNLVGWIWSKTRKAHLIVVVLTLLSWFLLGIWYGWGYCFLTDWHWSVKESLGERHLPNSFIKYALDRSFGHSFHARLVDQFTLGMFIAVVLVTIYVNFLRTVKKSG